MEANLPLAPPATPPPGGALPFAPASGEANAGFAALLAGLVGRPLPAVTDGAAPGATDLPADEPPAPDLPLSAAAPATLAVPVMPLLAPAGAGPGAMVAVAVAPAAFGASPTEPSAGLPDVPMPADGDPSAARAAPAVTAPSAAPGPSASPPASVQSPAAEATQVVASDPPPTGAAVSPPATTPAAPPVVAAPPRPAGSPRPVATLATPVGLTTHGAEAAPAEAGSMAAGSRPSADPPAGFAALPDPLPALATAGASDAATAPPDAVPPLLAQTGAAEPRSLLPDAAGHVGPSVLAAPAPAPAIAEPAPARPAAPPPMPARQVAPFAVALALGPDAAVSLTLEPVELGRVEVEIARSGAEAQISLRAERPETLALLVRDRAELERALAGAGLGAEDGRGPSLSFGLGAGNAGDGQRERQSAPRGQAGSRPVAAVTPAEATTRPAPARGLIDIAI
jgi:Meckel syndrome type 1 protein